MEPLTAFSLAASVVQFVAFAGGLLKKSIEIHGSTSGLPDTLDIDDTYRELSALSSSLQIFTDREDEITKVDWGIRRDIESVKVLARNCGSDCETLLKIVGKIKVEDGRGRRIRSLRAAFMALRKDGEIKQLEKRLAEAERQITLYLCRISYDYHDRHTQALQDLQQKAAALALDQRARFSSFEYSLNQIKSVVNTQFQGNTMGNTILPQVGDIENVRGLLAKVALSEKDLAREQKVLKSLAYEHYLDRYQSIDPAHKKTFSWVFDPANTSHERNRLAQWLRQGEGVFWITGKPGSGKSTMMKFLCDNTQTLTALREWARGTKLGIVSHYFWLSGTMMQKSQEGLFRSLLYGIFRQCPELIEKVCPERWAAAGRDYDIKSRQPHWTLEGLLDVVSTLPKIQQLGSKFCIFIDGLDEYQGDHIEMCNTIQKLGTTSRDIKLCVASRPWNDFEDAFGGGQHVVKMHQLTADDIREYAHARLSEHRLWSTVSTNTDLAISLIDLILRHAEGVFLWVVLVITELREGLSNYDSLEDLYRRVEGFPSDLEEFFMHILESVAPFYHAKMSTALQISLAAPQPLELSIYYFHEQEHANANYALYLPLSKPNDEVAEQRCKIIGKRLNGWCKGLLEVRKDSNDVHFLHRTVRDFLQTSEMAAFLNAKAPVHFCADLSIMRAYAAWMKSRTFYHKLECVEDDGGAIPNQYQAPFRWMTAGFLSAAYQVQCKQGDLPAQVQIEAFGCMDDFGRSVVELENQGQLRFQSVHSDSSVVKYAAQLWRQSLLRFKLVLYLSHRITNEPAYLAQLDMIRYIEAFTATQHPGSLYARIRKSLERLLEFGADPNEQAYPEYPFSSMNIMFATLMLDCGKATGTLDCPKPLAHRWLGSKKQLGRQRRWIKQIIQMGLVSLFLEFGANPNASFNCPECTLCRLMIAIPLEAESGTYEEETYLLELDCMFDYGADPERKIQQNAFSESAREWFFKQFPVPLYRNFHVIGEVALRLLRRIGNKEEAEACWMIAKRDFPPGIYTRMKSSVAGTKRKRDEGG